MVMCAASGLAEGAAVWTGTCTDAPSMRARRLRTMVLALKKLDLCSSLRSSADGLQGSTDAALWIGLTEGTNSAGRSATLDRWYSRQITAALTALLAKWQLIV